MIARIFFQEEKGGGLHMYQKLYEAKWLNLVIMEN